MEHFTEAAINVDLHFYFYASFYNDGSILNNLKNREYRCFIKYVKKQNNINMFAINDHSYKFLYRFDYVLLYAKLKESNVVKKTMHVIAFDAQ